MDIKKKVDKQLSAGFSDAEIYSNLLKDGHTKEEINTAMKVAVEDIKRANRISSKGLLLGFGFLIVIILRIVRFVFSSGTGSILAFISIITGIILMLYWFSHRRGQA